MPLILTREARRDSNLATRKLVRGISRCFSRCGCDASHRCRERTASSLPLAPTLDAYDVPSAVRKVGDARMSEF